MKNDMPELRACPFCKGPGQRTDHLDSDDNIRQSNVKCKKCSFTVSLKTWQSRADLTVPKPTRDECESCEGTGRTECLPDSEHSHPCDDCNGELLKEFQRGYAAAIALEEPVINDAGLAEAISHFENGLNRQNLSIKSHEMLRVIINHALKSREKVAEVTVEELITEKEGYMPFEGYKGDSLIDAMRNVAAALYVIKNEHPQGIKIVDGGA